MTSDVPRDERTLFVENASYRLAYSVLSYGLLFAVMYRSYRFREPTWDLMALVMLGAIVSLGYQSRYDLPLKRRGFVVAIAVATVVGAIMAYFDLAGPK